MIKPNKLWGKALAVAILVFLILIFRLVVYRADVDVELGSRRYLTCSRNVSVEKRTIDIVMAADDGYVQNSAATLASVFLNCDASSRFRIHILDGGISQEKKDRLAKLKKIRPFELSFYDMNKFDWSVFPNNRDYITLATFYRLAIPEVLPTDIDKALYLDGDMIVEQDLKELWDTDLKDNLVAAVEDEESYTHSKRLNLPGNYFNAGVLLLNLRSLRKGNLLNDSVTYLEKNRRRIFYQDQDILNALLSDKCIFVSLKWNVNTGMYCGSSCKHYYSNADALQARKKPGIIHYTKKIGKPWYFFNTHPLTGEYWKYLNYTDFYKFSKRIFLPF